MPKKKDEGMSLDDAFADDDYIEYAKSKPRKLTKKEPKEIEKIEQSEDSQILIKSSKPIFQIKRGDKIKVDSLTLEVDAHVVLMEHSKTTKEMAIECFDQKTDKDYQIRYFNDQVWTSIEIYRLDEIVYNKISAKKIEW